MERLPGLRVAGLRRVGSLGFPEWPVDVVGRAGDTESSRLSTWMARVELRSSVAIYIVSALLPLSILRLVKNCEENRRETDSRCNWMRGEWEGGRMGDSIEATFCTSE